MVLICVTAGEVNVNLFPIPRSVWTVGVHCLGPLLCGRVVEEVAVDAIHLWHQGPLARGSGQGHVA